MRATNQIVPVAQKKTAGKAKRRHRRVRQSWAGCKCPEGSTYKATPRVTRGWTCLKMTPRGPRFVRATCSGESARLLPAPREYKVLPAATKYTALPSSTVLVGLDKRKTGSKNSRRTGVKKTSSSEKKKPMQGPDETLTGAACGCPEGAKRIQTKRGSRCQRNGKFVKTACVTGG